MHPRLPHPPHKSQKGPPDGTVKNLKWYKNNAVLVELTISLHFYQFEGPIFQIFQREHAPHSPKNQSRVFNRPKLGENVPILLENPESRLDFSRGTSILILKNSSHKLASWKLNIFVKL